MNFKCTFGFHKYVKGIKDDGHVVDNIKSCPVCGKTVNLGRNLELTHNKRIAIAKQVTKETWNRHVIKSKTTPTKKSTPRYDFHHSPSTYVPPQRDSSMDLLTTVLIVDALTSDTSSSLDSSSSSDWSGGGGDFSGGGASGSWDSGGSDSGGGFSGGGD